MSLFGDSPPPSRQPKSSLFDDEPGAKPASGAGLFADDHDDGNPGASPWDFPTPKKKNGGARRDVVKTLLPPGDVPDEYIDSFDSLSDGAAAVDPEQTKRLLDGGNVGPAEQTKILDIVGGGREALGRGEFNVLLALIGLAQEGDELSLDAVDERRSSTCSVVAICLDRPTFSHDMPLTSLAVLPTEH